MKQTNLKQVIRLFFCITTGLMVFPVYGARKPPRVYLFENKKGKFIAVEWLKKTELFFSYGYFKVKCRTLSHFRGNPNFTSH